MYKNTQRLISALVFVLLPFSAMAGQPLTTYEERIQQIVEEETELRAEKAELADLVASQIKDHRPDGTSIQTNLNKIGNIIGRLEALERQKEKIARSALMEQQQQQQQQIPVPSGEIAPTGHIRHQRELEADANTRLLKGLINKQ